MPSFKFVVVEWPNENRLPGDSIDYGEFLRDVVTGSIPIGAKVMKVCAPDYEFEVVDTGRAIRLVSKGGTHYSARINYFNVSGVLMRREG